MLRTLLVFLAIVSYWEQRDPPFPSITPKGQQLMALLGLCSLTPVIQEGMDASRTPEMISVEQAAVTLISWLSEMQSVQGANPDNRTFCSVTYNANGTVNASISGLPFTRKFGEAGIFFEVKEYIKGDTSEINGPIQSEPSTGARAEISALTPVSA